jgi:hypothetical protein
MKNLKKFESFENKDFSIKYFGKLTKDELNWLIRKGRKSYSGGELTPIFLNDKMIGGISWNLGGIDYIEFLPEYKGKGYLKYIVKDNIDDGKVKFVSASPELTDKLKKYGVVTYNENNDITTVHISITLYHGTCKANADHLISNGWKPTGQSGANMGQGRYLYLSSEPEDALWFAQEKGCDSVVEVKDIPIEYLRPDPEDEAGFTMKDLLERIDKHGFPAKFALWKELGKEHFKLK